MDKELFDYITKMQSVWSKECAIQKRQRYLNKVRTAVQKQKFALLEKNKLSQK
jgi:hypothetical protein